MLGGRVTFDGANGKTPMPHGKSFGLMTCWIHSDSAKTVDALVWWGDYSINGEKLSQRPAAERAFCNEITIPLKAGWNKFTASQGLAFYYAEFCIAPKNTRGLTFRSAPDFSAPESVLLAGAFTEEVFAALNYDSPEIAWREVPINAIPHSPLRNIAWTLPHAAPTQRSLPLTIDSATNSAAPTFVTIDMGKIVLGRPTFDISAPAGTTLDIGFAEETRNARARLDKTVVVYGADRFILAEGRQTAETFSPRGFRYLDLLISGNSAPVTIHSAGVVEQRYPYEFSGEFECSDPDFNRLWLYGKRTLELCSEDVFTDCPWRERTLYGGDMLAETATNASLSRDLRLVRQSLEIFLQSQGESGWLQCQAPMPRTTASLYDYPLLTSITVGWYLRMTNDKAFAQRALPVFRKMAATVSTWQRVDGIYSPPGRSFIDHGRRTTRGATSAFNSALTATFRAWADTAQIAGDPATSAAFKQLSDELNALITPAYFDASAGTFCDMPLADEGENCAEGTPANSWPLLFCDVDSDTAAAAIDAIIRSLETYAPNNERNSVSPYQMFYLLSALRRCGRADVAESAIRKVYALMLDNPTGTLWEHHGDGVSLTHAWSSAANFYFATAVLGVGLGLNNDVELAAIRIEPSADTLTWARGKVPHPLGDIAIAWERKADELHISVKAPEGIRVEIAPRGALAALKLNLTREE